MKAQTVLLTALLLASTGNRSLANLNGSDDFNDNVMDPAKWDVVAPFLTETNNRLEYIGDDSGMWTWTPNSGSYTQDWSITIDVHNSSTPSAEQDGTFEIAVFKDWENSFWVGLMALGSGGGMERKIDTGWNDVGIDTKLKLPTDAESAALRISYDATAGTLFSHYDAGSGFVLATNFNVNSWNLNDRDSLQVWVGGYSENLAVSSGQIYADNFQMVTLLDHAPITNCYPGGAGFTLEWVPLAGLDSVVQWSTNLVDTPFTNLSASLPYPVSIYTDTVTGAESKCFYRVDLE